MVIWDLFTHGIRSKRSSRADTLSGKYWWFYWHSDCISLWIPWWFLGFLCPDRQLFFFLVFSSWVFVLLFVLIESFVQSRFKWQLFGNNDLKSFFTLSEITFIYIHMNLKWSLDCRDCFYSSSMSFVWMIYSQVYLGKRGSEGGINIYQTLNKESQILENHK